MRLIRYSCRILLLHPTPDFRSVFLWILKVEFLFQPMHPAVISDDLSVDGYLHPCYHLSGRSLQPTLNIAIQGCPVMLFHPAEPSSSWRCPVSSLCFLPAVIHSIILSVWLPAHYWLPVSYRSVDVCIMHLSPYFRGDFWQSIVLS